MITQTLKQLSLIGFASTLLVASGCSNNTDKPANTVGANPASTRPATDSPEGWTDTPANQPPPNLGSQSTTGVPYCSQDKTYIYGTASGCLFSIEAYDEGEVHSLKCINRDVYIDDKLMNNFTVGNLSLKCE